MSDTAFDFYLPCFGNLSLSLSLSLSLIKSEDGSYDSQESNYNNFWPHGRKNS